MTEKDFIALLERFEHGKCTRDEKVFLEEWIDSLNSMESLKSTGSPFSNEKEKLSVKAALQESIKLEAGLSTTTRAKGKKIKTSKVITGQLYITRAMRIAASILLLMLAGFLGWYTYQQNIKAQYDITAVGSTDIMKKVLLSDGSIIWLKPHSSLSYPNKFKDDGTREVTLEGEALFEVEKDPSRPFIVHANEITTTVLGTSFNIKTIDDKTEVVVLTGKVLVTKKSDNQKVELLPQESAVYSHTNQQLRKIQEEVRVPLEKFIAGTEYDMSFENVKVMEIAKSIENKFEVKVEIKGSIGTCLITADFTDQSLESTLEMVSEALNAAYEINNKSKVILSGTGCE